MNCHVNLLRRMHNAEMFMQIITNIILDNWRSIFSTVFSSKSWYIRSETTQNITGTFRCYELLLCLFCAV